jgi:hypothetical protein
MVTDLFFLSSLTGCPLLKGKCAAQHAAYPSTEDGTSVLRGWYFCPPWMVLLPTMDSTTVHRRWVVRMGGFSPTARTPAVMQALPMRYRGARKGRWKGVGARST